MKERGPGREPRRDPGVLKGRPAGRSGLGLGAFTLAGGSAQGSVPQATREKHRLLESQGGTPLPSRETALQRDFPPARLPAC